MHSRGELRRAAAAEPLVIIGAGPFGLAVGADARHHGVPARILGEPLGFWRTNMPPGMVLRSASDWCLDPQDELTIERFLAESGRRPADVEPLPLAVYLDYTNWFADRAGIVPERRRVSRVDVDEDGTFRLETSIAGEDGDEVVQARAVVPAVGQRAFAYAPPELTAFLPPVGGCIRATWWTSRLCAADGASSWADARAPTSGPR